MNSPRQFLIGDYLRVVFKRKGLIIGVFLIVALGIGLSVVRQPTIYEVSGKILVTRSRADMVLTPAAAGSGSSGFILPQAQDLTSEVELLKSRALSKAVVKTLDLTREAQPSVGKSPVMLAALLEVPPSLAAWLPPWLGGGSAGPEGQEQPKRQEQSNPTRLDRKAASIQKGLTVQVLPGSSVIDVRYRNTNPEEAVQVLNTLLTLYLDRYLEIHRTPGVTEFFTSQRHLYEQKLRSAEAALREFEGRTALINTASQMEVYSRNLAEAEMKLDKNHYDVLDKRQKLASTKAHLATLPERIVTSQTTQYNPLIASLQMRLLDLQTERDKLLQSYTEQDRRVLDVEERIATLRQRIAAQREWVPSSETMQPHPLIKDLQDSMFGTQTSLQRLVIDEREAAEQIRTIKQRIGEIAQLAVDRAELTRDVRAHEEAYLLYQRKVEEARISEAMDQEKMMNVNVTEEASTPFAPITSKGLSYVFALMVGLVAGVGGGFLREFFDDSVKTAADVTSSTALPVLASIPDEKPHGKKGNGHAGMS